MERSCLIDRDRERKDETIYILNNTYPQIHTVTNMRQSIVVFV